MKGGEQMQTKYTPLGRPHLINSIGAILQVTLSMRKTWGKKAASRACRSSLLLLLNSCIGRPIKDKNASVTLITFTIHPDLARVWHFFATRSLRGCPEVQIVIVDCSGRLDNSHFPQTVVVPFCNFSHARKVDFFYTYLIEGPYVWLCDDDVMIIGSESFLRAYKELRTNDDLAVVSFCPRGWSIPVEGQLHKAMGTYSILFSRNVFMREGLSFSPFQSDRPEIGRIKGYYDTADFANEQLLRKGYRVLTDGYESDQIGFVGTSTSMLKCLQTPSRQEEYIARMIDRRPQTAAYHLVGLFCNWKIVQLFRHIFSRDPLWYPPVEPNALLRYTERLPEAERAQALALFERYEENYDRLRSIGNSFL